MSSWAPPPWSPSRWGSKPIANARRCAGMRPRRRSSKQTFSGVRASCDPLLAGIDNIAGVLVDPGIVVLNKRPQLRELTGRVRSTDPGLVLARDLDNIAGARLIQLPEEPCSRLIWI